MKNKYAKRNKIISALLFIVLLVGLSLLLYPIISEYWNSFHQSRAIAAYDEEVKETDEKSLEKWRTEALAYNISLQGKQTRFSPSEEEKKVYEKLLDVSGKGIMGYIEIPKIGVSLPIYHGTDKEVLQSAIGHIEGSSVPVGGKGSHCVISGHRGLPSSKLFTDIDQLKEGDIFMLRVLNETLTYEVDQIRIVKPDDISFLAIEEDQDFCTLMTCTPYGVNSHRLLVRGHRVENTEKLSTIITADAVQINPKLVASILAVPILSIFLPWSLFNFLKNKNEKTQS